MYNISIKIIDNIFQKLSENERILNKPKTQILKEIDENWYSSFS